MRARADAKGPMGHLIREDGPARSPGQWVSEARTAARIAPAGRRLEHKDARSSGQGGELGTGRRTHLEQGAFCAEQTEVHGSARASRLIGCA